MLTKQKILLGRSSRAESSRVRRPRRTVLPRGSQTQVLWSWDSFPGRLNQSDSESFLLVHAPLSQDGRQREGFWEVVRQVESPFDLSCALPVGGGLLAPCSLPGPAAIKQLMQMVTVVPGQGGRLQLVCFL